MPKYVSKLIEKSTDPKGGEGTAGQVAWIPQNDSAKITSHADHAESVGAWKRTAGEDKEKLKKTLKEREARANAGRGF